MLRLLIIAVVLSILCRWAFGKWPWAFFGARRTGGQDVTHARRLLGVSAQANQAQIVEAHKRLVRQVHPDRGGSDAQVHQANAARDLLIESLPDRERPS